MFPLFSVCYSQEIQHKKNLSYPVYDSKLQCFKAWSLGKKNQQMLPRSINNMQAHKNVGVFCLFHI